MSERVSLYCGETITNEEGKVLREGLKDSGMGKEGHRYALEEMTELKMVAVHRS